ncbi:hypothetical protein FG386_001769 [Cryptosporidium ryanae]|uniref:uncharacterized protein n=1 Tax=Cryptosporidium ryanae TaxID=515981 RepID=UPI00351A3AE8|nr:hypothetical protein FG386_001769 [Cryptosporidium ryanae]
MGKGKHLDVIKLDVSKSTETLVENYRREIEIKRLHEILNSMLLEENESMMHLLNTAYYDYSSISTEMLPLIDSFLPSIKQFQENIDCNINDVSLIVETYSNSILGKANKHSQFLIQKMELFLLKKCEIEINRCKEILGNTMKLFRKNRSTISLHAIRVVHHCIIKVNKLKLAFEYFSNVTLEEYIPESITKTDNIKRCLTFCESFVAELSEIVLFASEKLFLVKNDSSYGKEDSHYNFSILFQCIFLLELKNSFILKIKDYLNSKIMVLNIKKFEDDKLGFSNFILHLLEVFDDSIILSLIENMVFSIIISGKDQYLEFIIDVYINGIVLYILEISEKELPDKIIPPTAPMDLYLYQLNSLVKFVERSEFLITKNKFSSLTIEKSDETKFKILTYFRRNKSINNYTKKWKFGKYWNLLYRNILNRRINIRNEVVEFSKVYVYDSCKYWLKYTIEVIRQIRWIIGTSSIQNNSPLPPSKFMVPLFSRCLYTSLSFLYDYADYIISFENVYSNENNSQGAENNKFIWSKKIKPEHVCCIVLDVFSLKKWVKESFLNEIFYHIDIVDNEYIVSSEFKAKNFFIDIPDMKSTVEINLINNGFFMHIDNNLINILIDKTSVYLNNQIINLFDSGLRTIPCLHRLTNSISSNSSDDEKSGRVPSNYVENAKKPMEIFLLFSSNAINSVINDLDKNTLQELCDFYFKLISKTLEDVFSNVRLICEQQIISSKNQFSSLQKLTANKTFETVNVLGPNAVIEQYLIDVNFWIELTCKTISNFFISINADKLYKDFELLFKNKHSYIELIKLLQN